MARTLQRMIFIHFILSIAETNFCRNLEQRELPCKFNTSNLNEHRTSWEFIIHLQRQEISLHLWHPRVHYSIHKSLSLDHVLIQMSSSRVFKNRYFLCFQSSACFLTRIGCWCDGWIRIIVIELCTWYGQFQIWREVDRVRNKRAVSGWFPRWIKLRTKRKAIAYISAMCHCNLCFMSMRVLTHEYERVVESREKLYIGLSLLVWSIWLTSWDTVTPLRQVG